VKDVERNGPDLFQNTAPAVDAGTEGNREIRQSG